MYSQQHKFASYRYKNPENIKQNKTRLYEGNYLAYTKVDNFLMHAWKLAQNMASTTS